MRIHALRTLGKLSQGQDKLIEHAGKMAGASGENYYVKREAAKLIHPSCLLCADSKRHKREAERQNDHEPDQPHGHLGGGRLARV